MSLSRSSERSLHMSGNARFRSYPVIFSYQAFYMAAGRSRFSLFDRVLLHADGLAYFYTVIAKTVQGLDGFNGSVVFSGDII